MVHGNFNRTHKEAEKQMTTSVKNNSVFKFFFEKQKLTGPNFIDCKFFLWLLQLTMHGSKDKKEVVVLMVLTMNLDIQQNLAHLGAYDMLQELKAMFSKQAEQELLRTVREFHACKQEEGQSVSSYVLKMKNLHMGKTVNELHAMLKLHEDTLSKELALQGLRGSKKLKPCALSLYVGDGHRATGLRGSKKLKPCALSLYVGDGHRATVEAIGTYHLELPSGLFIVMNNFHYAPSITRDSRCVNVVDLIHLKLGNGDSSSFWEDKWYACGIIKELFPHLYALELHKHATVGIKLMAPSLDNSFRRRVRSGAEES
nr:hypothetical protein [Tanacetum cinerariifolium]